MWQNVQLLSFIFVFYWSPSSIIFVSHLELGRLTSTQAICLVSVVMIRKSGRASQYLSSSSVVQTHLKKHVHLTNCIHLKHHTHMQKRRMIVEVRRPAEVALMRELNVLQRSRTLRDPSASPLWKYPGLGSLLNKLDTESEKDDSGHAGYEGQTGLRRVESRAVNLNAEAARKGDASIITAGAVGEFDQSGLSGGEGWVEIRPRETYKREPLGKNTAAKASTSKSLTRERGKNKLNHHGRQSRKGSLDTELPSSPLEMREEIGSRKFARQVSSSIDPYHTSTGSFERFPQGRISYSSKDGKGQQADSSKNFFASADEQRLGSGHMKVRKKAYSSRIENSEDALLEDEAQPSRFGSDSVPHSKPVDKDIARSRIRNAKKSRKPQLQPSVGGTGKHRDGWDSRVTSSSKHGQKLQSSVLMSGGGATVPGGNDELEISELPQNGCGIPWNWSRIHSRGKNILDLAGRSLSCGASDSRTRRVGNPMFCSNPSSLRGSVAATASEHSDASFGTDTESLPLLAEPSTPLQSSNVSERGLEEGGPDRREKKGSLTKHGVDIRYMAERGLASYEDRHCSLSQKYVPKSFEEIVGQNLVTQGLSNALSKGRIGSVYIFYGPRGTGKTSCARVFAMGLNCISAGEPRPCGSCPECLEHNFGKTSMVKEISCTGNHVVRYIKSVMQDVSSSSSAPYKVFIVDECHCLSSQAWNAFLKVLDEAPRGIIFILSTSSLDQLPHTVVSRCQKFLFSKIRESDIVNRLQTIATKENLDADVGALKLISSTSEGSLRDAEMTLDQLSLLGQKISLSMVQELVGLISDDKLMNLLDFALSADTINTVRSLREILDSGVDPLNLMSQLAALITSILAGGYNLPEERRRRKFFRKNELTKEEMERLRQALKTLSEAEKQLRSTSDRTTWLTAALLQFAPDQSYLLPSSSDDRSVTQSPALPNDFSERAEFGSSSQNQVEHQERHVGLSELHARKVNGANVKPLGVSKILSESRKLPHQQFQSPQSSHGLQDVNTAAENNQVLSKSSMHYDDHFEASSWPTSVMTANELEDVWQRVLDAVHSNSMRQFLQTQAKLFSLGVSVAKAFAVACLEFSQPEHIARAERSRRSIAHAFQETLGYQVEIKVALAAKREEQPTKESASEGQPSITGNEQRSTVVATDRRVQFGEIVEDGQLQLRPRDMCQTMPESLAVYGTVPSQVHGPQAAAQRTNQNFELIVFEGGGTRSQVSRTKNHLNEEKRGDAWIQEAQATPRHYLGGAYKHDKHYNPSRLRSNSAGKGKLSLGFVMQQAEGSVDRYSQDIQFENANEALSRKHIRHRGPEFIFSGSQGGASSMATKLEEENLRLESRSGGLLCWKTTKRGLGKVKKIRGPRRPGLLMRLVPCAKSGRS